MTKGDTAKVAVDMLEDGWVAVEIPGQPWLYRGRVESIDGRPQLVDLQLEARAGTRASRAIITAAKLRSLPLRQIRAAVAGSVSLDLASIRRAAGPKRRPGQPCPADHHEDVAETYRNALAADQPPRAAIEAKWGVSRATASKWIRTAREQGRLGWPDGPGVAGDSSTASARRTGALR